jgi:hypothetical protein
VTFFQLDLAISSFFENDGMEVAEPVEDISPAAPQQVPYQSRIFAQSFSQFSVEDISSSPQQVPRSSVTNPYVPAAAAAAVDATLATAGLNFLTLLPTALKIC